MTTSAFEAITQTLRNDGVAVVRTDTIYGIIARADSEAAVEKVYAAKHRNPAKQCIVLLSTVPSDFAYGSIIQQYSAEAAQPTSVIVPATHQPSWLLRGGDTLAYRVVRDPFLRSVVEAVGPVIAPSANPESLPPARTIEEAKSYFGETVDCYIDGGEVGESVSASAIVSVNESGAISFIRNAS
jgi:L-threonylcarbamoyladenylate synthase